MRYRKEASIEASFLFPAAGFRQQFLCGELGYHPHDQGRQQQAHPERQQQQDNRLRPFVMKKMRDEGPEKEEQRAVDAQCDDRKTPQIGDNGCFLHLLAQQHDVENTRESSQIDLNEVSGIVVGPHAQRRGRKVHRDQRQQDEQRNQLVETVVRKEEKVVTPNPEPREIERQGRHGDIDVERQFDPLLTQPEPGGADQQHHDEHRGDMFPAQVMDKVEQDVAVEKGHQKPDRRVEADQFVPPENQQQFAPPHRKAECPRHRFRDTVHQQERPEVKDQEGHEQFIDLAGEEAAESLVGFEEKARNEEIERHGETRQHGPGGEAVKRAPDMHHYDKHDAEPFRKVNEPDPPIRLLFHRAKITIACNKKKRQTEIY